MKMLGTADLHVHSKKWDNLRSTCEALEPEIVLVAGDLLPKMDGIKGELRFLPSMKKRLKEFKKMGCKFVTLLGNDDNQLAIETMEEWHAEGLLYHVHNRVVEINGYEFAGLSFVPDHPFGYKYWSRKEYKDVLRIDPEQRSKPLIMNKDNEFETIPDYEAFLQERESIFDLLTDLSKKVKDIKKSIWLIHSPPVGLGLDVCQDGRKVGSMAVRDFIDQVQPFFTIHGHIHESPQVSGRWFNTIGKTLCIQTGQPYEPFYYAKIDVEETRVRAVHPTMPSEVEWDGVSLYGLAGWQ